jgi:hypothetical protein
MVAIALSDSNSASCIMSRLFNTTGLAQQGTDGPATLTTVPHVADLIRFGQRFAKIRAFSVGQIPFDTIQ